VNVGATLVAFMRIVKGMEPRRKSRQEFRAVRGLLLTEVTHRRFHPVCRAEHRSFLAAVGWVAKPGISAVHCRVSAKAPTQPTQAVKRKELAFGCDKSG